MRVRSFAPPVVASPFVAYFVLPELGRVMICIGSDLTLRGASRSQLLREQRHSHALCGGVLPALRAGVQRRLGCG